MDFDCFMSVDEFQITQHELQGEFMRKFSEFMRKFSEFMRKFYEFMRKFSEFMRKFNTNILCLCCVI